MNESKGKIGATKDTVNGLNAKLEPVEVMKADFVYITFTYCTMIIHRLPLQVSSEISVFIVLQMRLAELAGIADDVFELEKKVGKYCLNVEPLWKILYL